MRLSIEYSTKNDLELDLRLSISSNNLCIFKCNLFDQYQENGCKVFDRLSLKSNLMQLISKSTTAFE